MRIDINMRRLLVLASFHAASCLSFRVCLPLCRVVSCRVVLCRVVSCRVVLCRVVCCLCGNERITSSILGCLFKIRGIRKYGYSCMSREGVREVAMRNIGKQVARFFNVSRYNIVKFFVAFAVFIVSAFVLCVAAYCPAIVSNSVIGNVFAVFCVSLLITIIEIGFVLIYG